MPPEDTWRKMGDCTGTSRTKLPNLRGDDMDEVEQRPSKRVRYSSHENTNVDNDNMNVSHHYRLICKMTQRWRNAQVSTQFLNDREVLPHRSRTLNYLGEHDPGEFEHAENEANYKTQNRHGKATDQESHQDFQHQWDEEIKLVSQDVFMTEPDMVDENAMDIDDSDWLRPRKPPRSTNKGSKRKAPGDLWRDGAGQSGFGSMLIKALNEMPRGDYSHHSIFDAREIIVPPLSIRFYDLPKRGAIPFPPSARDFKAIMSIAPEVRARHIGCSFLASPHVTPTWLFKTTKGAGRPRDFWLVPQLEKKWDQFVRHLADHELRHLGVSLSDIPFRATLLHMYIWTENSNWNDWIQYVTLNESAKSYRFYIHPARLHGTTSRNLSLTF
jgi:hypothetical protein